MSLQDLVSQRGIKVGTSFEGGEETYGGFAGLMAKMSTPLTEERKKKLKIEKLQEEAKVMQRQADIANSFGGLAKETLKGTANTLYDVGTGLLMPGITPEEARSGTFMKDFALGLPKAVWQVGKQIVTHPIDSIKSAFEGAARGTSDTLTNIMVNQFVPEPLREGTREEVKKTLDKYLGEEKEGDFIKGGFKVGGEAAPFMAAGMALGELGGAAGATIGGNIGRATGTLPGGTIAGTNIGAAKVGGQIGGFLGEVGGFVGVGQATLEKEASWQQRSEQAARDLAGLGLFKVGGYAFGKAKGSIYKALKAKETPPPPNADAGIYEGPPQFGFQKMMYDMGISNKALNQTPSPMDSMYYKWLEGRPEAQQRLKDIEFKAKTFGDKKDAQKYLLEEKQKFDDQYTEIFRNEMKLEELYRPEVGVEDLYPATETKLTIDNLQKKVVAMQDTVVKLRAEVENNPFSKVPEFKISATDTEKIVNKKMADFVEGLNKYTPDYVDSQRAADMYKNYKILAENLKIAEERLGSSMREYNSYKTDMKSEAKSIEETIGGAKIVPETKFTPKEVPISETTYEAGPKVMQGEPGEGAVSKIARIVNEKAIESGMTNGLFDLAEYGPLTIREQSKAVGKLMNSDFARFERVIEGKESVPAGINPMSIIVGADTYMTAHPTDMAFAQKFASSPLVSQSSMHAQGLAMLANRNPRSFSTLVQAITNVRREEAAKRLHTKDIGQEISKEIGKVKKEKIPVKKKTLSEFIKDIEC